MVLQLVQRDGGNYTYNRRKGQQKNQVTGDIAGHTGRGEISLSVSYVR
jgi:hypothetical protein